MLREESVNLADYLQDHSCLDLKGRWIEAARNDLAIDQKQLREQQLQQIFAYVRDQFFHSWDIQNPQVTMTAAEVWQSGHGICYAKANLLAALLRKNEFPTGFCYQRLLLFDEIKKQYCVHALNAVWINGYWLRIDARGHRNDQSKPFSLTKDYLAFHVDPNLGEVDYPTIYVEPHFKTITTLKKADNSLFMYANQLPETI